MGNRKKLTVPLCKRESFDKNLRLFTEQKHSFCYKIFEKFELGYSTMEESLVADFMKNLYRTAGILKEMMDG